MKRMLTKVMNGLETITPLKAHVLLGMLLIAAITVPTAAVSPTAQIIHYDVPYISQLDFSDWGESACGPTSITMVLRYYFPNSHVGVPEVYHAATQTVNYAGPLLGYHNIGADNGTIPANTWLSRVPTVFQPYYSGKDDGMDPAYAVTYLRHVWPVTAQLTYTTLDAAIAELANGPFIMNVAEIAGFGHFLVVIGYDPSAKTFYVNDPYPPYAAKTNQSAQNRAVSYLTMSSWYKGRILIIRPDSTLSVTDQKFTTVVDNGVNNDQSPGNNDNCTALHSCFMVDNIQAKTAAGGYAWWLQHSFGADFAYATEAGHTARWTPYLSAGGWVDVNIRTDTGPKAGVTKYVLRDAAEQQMGSRLIDQRNATVIEKSASLGRYFLNSGVYVNAVMAANSPVDAVAFVYRDTPAAAPPQASFTASTSGTLPVSGAQATLTTAAGTNLAVTLSAPLPPAPGLTFEWFDDTAKIGTGATLTTTLTKGIHLITQQVTRTADDVAANTSMSIDVIETPTVVLTVNPTTATLVAGNSVTLTVTATRTNTTAPVQLRVSGQPTTFTVSTPAGGLQNMATITIAVPATAAAATLPIVIQGVAVGVTVKSANATLQVQAAPAPKVSLAPSTLTFGSQAVGTTSASSQAKLTNNGNATLHITSITASGDFLLTNPCSTALAPGASCTMTVTFKPTGTGARNGILTATTDGGTVSIALSGTGTPKLSVSTTTLAFGNQMLNTSNAQRLTVTNTGTAPLTISSMSLAGTNAGDFSQNNTCSSSIVGGSTCTITITFKPAALGSRSATLNVSSNGGTATTALSGTGTGTPNASLSTTSLNFGTLTLNTTGTQKLTLSNTGSAPLSISSIKIQGTNAGDFSQSNNCPSSLGAATACTISLAFRPTAVGTRTSSLGITSNGGSPVVNLTGTGKK
jgi:hypothetical protein